MLTPRPNPHAEVLAELRARQAAAQAATEQAGPQLTLRDFMREAWAVNEPSKALIWGWHLDCLCDHAEAVFRREILRLLVNMPPGFAKSYVWSVMLPAWGWTRDASERWLCVSNTAGLASRDSRRTRNIVRDEWYRERWGARVQLAADQQEKLNFATTATGSRVVQSMGGEVTGHRGGVLLIDDPQSVGQAHSDAERENTGAMVTETLLSRVDDQKTSPIVVVQQRLHVDDVSARLLATGDWQRLCLRQEYDPRAIVVMPLREWRDPRTEPGELLNPQQMGPAEVERERKSITYEAQHNQEPTPLEGRIFLRSDWRWCDRLPERFDYEFLSMDASMGSESSTASRVAIGAFGVRGAEVYVRDVVAEVMDYDAQEGALQGWGAAHPRARAKVVEKKAAGPILAKRLARSVPGIVMWPPKGEAMESKLARAMDATPRQRAGNVWIPKGAAWSEAFVRELAAFPGGLHDDQVDMFSQAIAYVESRRVVDPESDAAFEAAVARIPGGLPTLW